MNKIERLNKIIKLAKVVRVHNPKVEFDPAYYTAGFFRGGVLLKKADSEQFDFRNLLTLAGNYLKEVGSGGFNFYKDLINKINSENRPWFGPRGIITKPYYNLQDPRNVGAAIAQLIPAFLVARGVYDRFVKQSSVRSYKGLLYKFGADPQNPPSQGKGKGTVPAPVLDPDIRNLHNILGYVARAPTDVNNNAVYDPVFAGRIERLGVLPRFFTTYGRYWADVGRRLWHGSDSVDYEVWRKQLQAKDLQELTKMLSRVKMEQLNVVEQARRALVEQNQIYNVIKKLNDPKVPYQGTYMSGEQYTPPQPQPINIPTYTPGDFSRVRSPAAPHLRSSLATSL